MAYGFEVFDNDGNKILDHTARYLRPLGPTFGNSAVYTDVGTDYTYAIPQQYISNKITFWVEPVTEVGYLTGGHYAYRVNNTIYFKSYSDGYSVHGGSYCHIVIFD